MKVSIERNSGVISNSSGWIPRNIQNVLTNIPGKFRFVQGKFYFELSGINIDFICRNFPDIEWTDLAKDRMIKYLKKKQEMLSDTDKETFDTSKFAFDFKTQPFEHQKLAFFISRDKHAFGFFMEMGTGKSKVLIDTAAHLYASGEIDTLLVLAPNGVHRQWIEEQIPVHLPDWVEHESVLYRSGMGKKDRENYERILHSKLKALKIIAMNTEAVSVKSGNDALNEIVLNNKCLLVVDESSRIKTPNANRTKNIIAAGRAAPYRRILSGTPLTKNIQDLYAQFRFLDPDILGFNSFWTFKSHHLRMGGFENKQVIGYRNLAEFKEKVDGWTYTIKKEQCLDLPEKIYMTREVELTPDQIKLYKQLKNDFLALLDSGELIEAPLAITRLMYLQRVLCGHLQNPEKDVVERVKSNRATICREVVEEFDGQVIIWVRFREDFTILQEELKKYSLSVYRGDQKDIDEFKAGKTDIFIANPQSAGLGLNLQQCHNVIYYSNSFNAEERWQSEDRTHRMGQTESVTYVDLICRKTVDEKIVHALRAKKSISDLIVYGKLRDMLGEDNGE